MPDNIFAPVPSADIKSSKLAASPPEVGPREIIDLEEAHIMLVK